VEAWAFLHTHRFLLRALPQYRSELERIAAMARPMLPAWMRPRPLSIARGADLPMPAPKQCPLESGTA
jgi:hypothetical protein